MSTHFILSRKVSADELFGGRLERFGVREHVASATTEQSRCLTDGRNCLWVCLTEDGFVGSISRYGANAPGKIIGAISNAFETYVFSEYEPQYWGFETEEEWHAAMKAMADEDRDRFYANICAYIQGEPNDIRIGTIGEIEAKIGKALVEQDSALLRPENKDRLMAEIEIIYNRDHAVTVTLTPEDMALAKMLATHEDDLPKG
jgi:hypothetical protein